VLLSASYDWLQAEFDNKPSGYIIDLIAFLRGIFTSFTNLPVSLLCDVFCLQSPVLFSLRHMNDSFSYFTCFLLNWLRIDQLVSVHLLNIPGTLKY